MTHSGCTRARLRLGLRPPRRARRLVVVAALAMAPLAAPSAAMAWKPFTHIAIGDRAYSDATQDGAITIGTRSYPLDARLVAALRKYRPYYNAGVVGPDGFPDIAFGQSVIHPDQTGKWLRYVLTKAWAAQSDPQYSTIQRGQILAFAYGYLTHAAGDMWGHSLINDFAQGLFPSVDDLTDPTKAKIAIRHIVAEGYVGSATPGWDRSIGGRTSVCAGRQPTPGTNCNDISDDQTGAIAFSVPRRFVYNVFVDPKAVLPVGTCGDGVDDDHDGVVDDGCPGHPYTAVNPDGKREPEPKRGPLLDSFLDYEAKAQIDAARIGYDATHRDCDGSKPYCTGHAVKLSVDTVRGIRPVSIISYRCATGRTCDFSRDRDTDGDRREVAADLRAWISHIDAGLQAWPTFSLAVTKALFDPQTRRDVQNHKCRNRGTDTDETRATCENDIGLVTTLLSVTKPYVDTHLLYMLGLPKDVVDTKVQLQELADAVDDAVGPALNPIRWAVDKIEELVGDYVKDAIRAATGIDVDQLRDFLAHPARWMCNAGKPSFTLPGLKGAPPILISPRTLFTTAEHRRLDAFMGLPAIHHRVSGDDCTGLRDSAQFNTDTFAAFKDSVTQAKLLLLNGTQLDAALGDVLTDAQILKSPSAIHSYPTIGGEGSVNVMFTALGTTAVNAPTAPSWLALIDGDHAWRSDALPRFCDRQTTCLKTAESKVPATPRRVKAGESTGGNGTYPLWESCVLRPAFRALFTDWESSTNFPDLGDAVSPDPVTDPAPPAVSITPASITTTIAGTPFVLPGATFTLAGHDAVFTDRAVTLAYRIYAAGATPGQFSPVPNGGTVALPAGALTGTWTVEVVASDYCSSQTSAQTFGVA